MNIFHIIKTDNISQTASKRYAEMVLALIFNSITCLSCYMSNGFWLGHKVGFSGAVFFTVL